MGRNYGIYREIWKIIIELKGEIYKIAKYLHHSKKLMEKMFCRGRDSKPQFHSDAWADGDACHANFVIFTKMPFEKCLGIQFTGV